MRAWNLGFAATVLAGCAGGAGRAGFVAVPGGRIWYHEAGGGRSIPLLVIHGGPGGRSCRLAAFDRLGRERRVVRYDQLGTGRSDRPVDTTLWRLPRFVEEIDSLRRRLGLVEVHLLGQSWGGAVAAEYALTRPNSGVRSLILASPLLSTPRWMADARILRAALPAELQRTLDRHEAAGTIDHPEYVAATDSFYARHLSRRQPAWTPPECEGVTGNDSVYRYMWGPTEFNATGTLLSYDRSDRLGELRLPVLLVTGEFDEARPATVGEFARSIPGARFEVIEGSGHATAIDRPDRVTRVVADFLREVESR